jgi:hypothetical protein
MVKFEAPRLCWPGRARAPTLPRISEAPQGAARADVNNGDGTVTHGPTKVPDAILNHLYDRA